MLFFISLNTVGLCYSEIPYLPVTCLLKHISWITSNSQNVHNAVQSVMHFNHLILPRYTRCYLADTNMIVTLLMRNLCPRAVKWLTKVTQLVNGLQVVWLRSPCSYSCSSAFFVNKSHPVKLSACFFFKKSVICQGPISKTDLFLLMEFDRSKL